MPDDNPVTPPAEAEKPEDTNTSDNKPDEVSETVATSDDKTTETANATDDKKEPESENAELAASGDATESKDEDESAAAPADADAASAGTNGASAPAEKSAKDRRRSSGVGEKPKQLNRKKSQIRTTHLHAKPGEYYLARFRGYAPWPSIICDEEILPQTMLETRPVTAMQEDGTYRADYADDGKRAHERTFPVMFFNSNEFAWIINTALTPLDPADCKDVSPKNKSKSLLAAYEVAAEGHDLKYFKSLLADHQAAVQQEMDEAEAEENAKAAAKAEKAEKSKKTKRKSKGADTDVEMEDTGDKKPKSSKKRKNAEAEDEAEKPAKTPKTSTKLKLTTPKAPAEENGKKTPASKTKKAPTKRGKAAAKEEEEEAAEAKEPEKQIDPEESKKKKEKEILFIRHKLQKGFISRDQPPQEDEMAAMGPYFDKLEKHADLEVSIIRSTKINKVLKMIVKLNSIPRDEEFNFRHRAMHILSSWKAVLDSDTPAPDKDSKPTANGGSKDDESAETPKLETEEEKELENKAGSDDTPMPDADADAGKDKPEEDKEEVTEDNEPAEKEPTEEKTVEASA